jgi:tRNA threonylcarbamoyladenosine biosynthesis protein TsaE
MKNVYIFQHMDSATVNTLAAFFYSAQNTLPRVVLLEGEVGTGKTTFARSYVLSGQIDASFASPTYSIVRPYELGNVRVNHFDLYRISEDDYEWIYEYLDDASAINLFEWGSLHRSLVDEVDYLELSFIYDTAETRNITLVIDEKYEKVIEEFLTDEDIVFTKCNESINHEVR